MPCDMCGAETSLVLAEIEGAKLQVCRNCASFGKIIRRVRSPREQTKIRKTPSKPRPRKPPEPEWVLVKDFSKRIRDKREQMRLKQKELAHKLAEKESLLHKIETGQFKPSIDLARKMERILNITLLEKHEPIESDISKKGSAEGGPLTLGDILSVKKK